MEDWLELSTSDFIPIPQSLNFEAEQVLLPLKILMMYFLYLLVRNAKMDSTPIQICKKNKVTFRGMSYAAFGLI